MKTFSASLPQKRQHKIYLKKCLKGSDIVVRPLRVLIYSLFTSYYHIVFSTLKYKLYNYVEMEKNALVCYAMPFTFGYRTADPPLLSRILYRAEID